MILKLALRDFQTDSDWKESPPIKNKRPEVSLRTQLDSESVLEGDCRLVQHYLSAFEIFSAIEDNFSCRKTDFWIDLKFSESSFFDFVETFYLVLFWMALLKSGIFEALRVLWSVQVRKSLSVIETANIKNRKIKFKFISSALPISFEYAVSMSI